MRGKEAAPRLPCGAARITPAYAGKSLSETSIRPRLEDHPRVCGEKRRNGLQRTNPSGSPPRMRGKGRRWPESVAANGITPAYAGKSLCGLCLCRSRLGSPPRMRGKERLAKNQRSVHGITPAYAGKSTFHVFPDGLPWDHPRVCGEKERVSRCACWSEGSPPRMRGKEPGTLRTVRVSRITPAYAGKRKPIKMAKKRARDHPRVCGEKKKHNMWW